MENWLLKLLGLGKPTPKAPLPEIHAGEKWSLASCWQGPWPPKTYPHSPVTILDVKEGWVRYDMGFRPYRDERMELEMFVTTYRKWENGYPCP